MEPAETFNPGDLPMRDVLSLILLVVLLSGCAVSPRWVWKHRQNSEEQTRQDMEICRRQAIQGAPGMPMMTPDLGADLYEARQDLMRNCMQEKGYYYEKVKRPQQ
jgi:hypothetical protein